MKIFDSDEAIQILDDKWVSPRKFLLGAFMSWRVLSAPDVIDILN